MSAWDVLGWALVIAGVGVPIFSIVLAWLLPTCVDEDFWNHFK